MQVKFTSDNSILSQFLNQLVAFCEHLKGTTETYPFDEHTLVYKVGGKMYLLIDTQNPDSLNIKCDPDFAIELRAKYDAVLPGYHMNKKHWNTVLLNGSIQDTEILAWVEHSYNLVFQSLSKKIQQTIADSE